MKDQHIEVLVSVISTGSITETVAELVEAPGRNVRLIGAETLTKP